MLKFIRTYIRYVKAAYILGKVGVRYNFSQKHLYMRLWATTEKYPEASPHFIAVMYLMDMLVNGE